MTIPFDPKEVIKMGKGLNECFTDPELVVNHEITTIEYLKHQSAGLTDLSEMCMSCCNNLVKDKNGGMCFHLSWPILDEIYNYTVLEIHVGVLINVLESVITDTSYHFCVTENRKVIKRIHFDYTCPCNKRNSPQPLFHVQFPGELPGHMGEEYEIDHLYPKVSEPRIIYFPMTLALLLHMVFSEFPTRDTDKIKEDGRWLKNHIGRDQKNILRPFVEKQLSVIDEDKPFWDYIYVQ